MARQARSRDRRRQVLATSRTSTSAASSSPATAASTPSCRLQAGTEVSYAARTSLTRRTPATSMPAGRSAARTRASAAGSSVSNQTCIRADSPTWDPQCCSRSRSTTVAAPLTAGTRGSAPTATIGRLVPLRLSPTTAPPAAAAPVTRAGTVGGR